MGRRRKKKGRKTRKNTTFRPLLQRNLTGEPPSLLGADATIASTSTIALAQVSPSTPDERGLRLYKQYMGCLAEVTVNRTGGPVFEQVAAALRADPGTVDRTFRFTTPSWDSSGHGTPLATLEFDDIDDATLISVSLQTLPKPKPLGLVSTSTSVPSTPRASNATFQTPMGVVTQANQRIASRLLVGCEVVICLDELDPYQIYEATVALLTSETGGIILVGVSRVRDSNEDIFYQVGNGLQRRKWVAPGGKTGKPKTEWLQVLQLLSERRQPMVINFRDETADELADLQHSRCSVGLWIDQHVEASDPLLVRIRVPSCRDVVPIGLLPDVPPFSKSQFWKRNNDNVVSVKDYDDVLSHLEGFVRLHNLVGMDSSSSLRQTLLSAFLARADAAGRDSFRVLDRLPGFEDETFDKKSTKYLVNSHAAANGEGPIVAKVRDVVPKYVASYLSGSEPGGGGDRVLLFGASDDDVGIVHGIVLSPLDRDLISHIVAEFLFEGTGEVTETRFLYPPLSDEQRVVLDFPAVEVTADDLYVDAGTDALVVSVGNVTNPTAIPEIYALCHPFFAEDQHSMLVFVEVDAGVHLADNVVHLALARESADAVDNLPDFVTFLTHGDLESTVERKGKKTGSPLKGVTIDVRSVNVQDLVILERFCVRITVVGNREVYTTGVPPVVAVGDSYEDGHHVERLNLIDIWHEVHSYLHVRDGERWRHFMDIMDRTDRFTIPIIPCSGLAYDDLTPLLHKFPLVIDLSNENHRLRKHLFSLRGSITRSKPQIVTPENKIATGVKAPKMWLCVRGMADDPLPESSTFDEWEGSSRHYGRLLVTALSEFCAARSIPEPQFIVFRDQDEAFHHDTLMFVDFVRAILLPRFGGRRIRTIMIDNERGPNEPDFEQLEFSTVALMQQITATYSPEPSHLSGEINIYRPGRVAEAWGLSLTSIPHVRVVEHQRRAMSGVVAALAVRNFWGGESATWETVASGAVAPRRLRRKLVDEIYSKASSLSGTLRLARVSLIAEAGSGASTLLKDAVYEVAFSEERRSYPCVEVMEGSADEVAAAILCVQDALATPGLIVLVDENATVVDDDLRAALAQYVRVRAVIVSVVAARTSDKSISKLGLAHVGPLLGEFSNEEKNLFLGSVVETAERLRGDLLATDDSPMISSSSRRSACGPSAGEELAASLEQDVRSLNQLVETRNIHVIDFILTVRSENNTTVKRFTNAVMSTMFEANTEWGEAAIEIVRTISFVSLWDTFYGTEIPLSFLHHLDSVRSIPELNDVRDLFRNGPSELLRVYNNADEQPVARGRHHVLCREILFWLARTERKDVPRAMRLGSENLADLLWSIGVDTMGSTAWNIAQNVFVAKIATDGRRPSHDFAPLFAYEYTPFGDVSDAIHVFRAVMAKFGVPLETTGNDVNERNVPANSIAGVGHFFLQLARLVRVTVKHVIKSYCSRENVVRARDDAVWALKLIELALEHSPENSLYMVHNMTGTVYASFVELERKLYDATRGWRSNDFFVERLEEMLPNVQLACQHFKYSQQTFVKQSSQEDNDHYAWIGQILVYMAVVELVRKHLIQSELGGDNVYLAAQFLSDMGVRDDEIIHLVVSALSELPRLLEALASHPAARQSFVEEKTLQFQSFAKLNDCLAFVDSAVEGYRYAGRDRELAAVRRMPFNLFKWQLSFDKVKPDRKTLHALHDHIRINVETLGTDVDAFVWLHQYKTGISDPLAARDMWTLAHDAVEKISLGGDEADTLRALVYERMIAMVFWATLDDQDFVAFVAQSLHDNWRDFGPSTWTRITMEDAAEILRRIDFLGFCGVHKRSELELINYNEYVSFVKGLNETADPKRLISAYVDKFEKRGAHLVRSFGILVDETRFPDKHRTRSSLIFRLKPRVGFENLREARLREFDLLFRVRATVHWDSGSEGVQQDIFDDLTHRPGRGEVDMVLVFKPQLWTGYFGDEEPDIVFLGVNTNLRS